MNSKESIIIFVVGMLMVGGAVGAYVIMTNELHRVPASSLAVMPQSTSTPAPASGSVSFGGITKPNTPTQSVEQKLAALKQSTGGASTATPAAQSPVAAATSTALTPAPKSDIPMVIPSEAALLAARAAAPAAATNMYADAITNTPKLSAADATALLNFINENEVDSATEKKALALVTKYAATLAKFDTYAKKKALACSTWATPHACDTATVVRLGALQYTRVVSLLNAQKIPQAIALATLLYSMGDKIEEYSDSVAAYDAALTVRGYGIDAFALIAANDKATDDDRTAMRKVLSSSLPEKTWNKRAIQNDIVNLGVIALRAIDAGSAATSSKYMTKSQAALITSYTARKKVALAAKNEEAWDAFETYRQLYELNAAYAAAIDNPCPASDAASAVGLGITANANADMSSSTPNWLGAAFVKSWTALFPATAKLNQNRCSIEKAAGEV